MPNPALPLGYSPVPAGCIATIVTYLEMTEPPGRSEPGGEFAYVLRRLVDPDPGEYRALYRRIGADWLWYGRLVMPDPTLAGILSDPQVEVHVAYEAGQAIGILELDFREKGQCEIVYLGLVREAIGRGAGRWLMHQALALAWGRPIERLWLHTCSFDHPSALGFYRRSGFHPYAFTVEVVEDPRLTGHLPGSAAPHVPLIPTRGCWYNINKG